MSIGKIGSISCAAVACDEDSQLAALVKKENESLMDLLKRLDKSIILALEEEKYIDEISG